ncbi:MAG: hypothetical protein K6G11_08690 [Lachnospiraceae bacterium]|nr:hypothetical protein [Lachnospiraceae bacterium]
MTKSNIRKSKNTLLCTGLSLAMIISGIAYPTGAEASAAEAEGNVTTQESSENISNYLDNIDVEHVEADGEFKINSGEYEIIHVTDPTFTINGEESEGYGDTLKNDFKVYGTSLSADYSDEEILNESEEEDTLNSSDDTFVQDSIAQYRTLSSDDSYEFFEDCSTDYGYRQLYYTDNYSISKSVYDSCYTDAKELFLNPDNELKKVKTKTKSYKVFCTVTCDEEITGECADAVYLAFLSVLFDHPLLYFAETSMLYSENYAMFFVSEDFEDASFRVQVQDKLQEVITGNCEQFDSYKSTYEILKGIHDLICNWVSYADLSSGANSRIYHSVAGFILNDLTVVCEGYASMFSAMCNYLDLKVIFVAGYSVQSDEKYGHAWNYARLDDGNYYSIDITWDDAISSDTFISDYYFCKGDSFYDNHEVTDGKIINADNNYIYSYILPDNAEEDFEYDETQKARIVVDDPDYDLYESSVDNIVQFTSDTTEDENVTNDSETTNTDDANADNGNSENTSSDDANVDNGNSENTSSDDANANNENSENTSSDDANADNENSGNTSSDDANANNENSENTGSDDANVDNENSGNAGSDDANVDNGNSGNTSSDDANVDNNTDNSNSNNTNTTENNNSGNTSNVNIPNSTANQSNGLANNTIIYVPATSTATSQTSEDEDEDDDEEYEDIETDGIATFTKNTYSLRVGKAIQIGTITGDADYVDIESSNCLNVYIRNNKIYAFAKVTAAVGGTYKVKVSDTESTTVINIKIARKVTLSAYKNTRVYVATKVKIAKRNLRVVAPKHIKAKVVRTTTNAIILSISYSKTVSGIVRVKNGNKSYNFRVVFS